MAGSVLLADDEEIVRQMGVSMLESPGIRVQKPYNLKKADVLNRLIRDPVSPIVRKPEL